MPAFGPPLLNAGDAINDRLLLFLPGTEDGGGLTNDLSPRRANGTLVNSPSRVSGALAKAIRLNGSNQYISTAAGQSIPGGFSATARVKLDAAAAYDNSILSSILGVDQTILWNVTAYGTILQFWATTSSGQATATGFPSILGRWADIGVSWAPGRTTRFYVDGNYVGGGNTAGDIQTAITGWNVGRYGVPGIWYFPGDVHLVRTWARVLPDSDFRRLSNDPWAGIAQSRRRIVGSGVSALTATIAGTVDVTASVEADLALAATLAGTVAVTASLETDLALAATIGGTVDVTGALAATTTLAAVIDGTVPITASILAQLDRLADITGTVAVTASLTATNGEGGGGDTHDGFKRRSRRERRLDALRARRDEERLADAQALRMALEAALGLGAEIAAPVVAKAVQATPKPAEVDWKRVAERDEDYARLSRTVARLTAAVEAEARRRADDDDDEEAMFLMGLA